MKLRKTLTTLALAMTALALLFMSPAKAGRRSERQFSLASLNGSYGSSGRADGFLSRSIGVTWFDGAGHVSRVVSINTSDGAGGRRLLRLVATGTYSVTPDGMGTIHLSNEFETGTTSEVNFDFVVSKSSIEKDRTLPMADEITGIQREAGQTASLVKNMDPTSWTLKHQSPPGESGAFSLEGVRTRPRPRPR